MLVKHYTSVTQVTANVYKSTINVEQIIQWSFL